MARKRSSQKFRKKMFLTPNWNKKYPKNQFYAQKPPETPPGPPFSLRQNMHIPWAFHVRPTFFTPMPRRGMIMADKWWKMVKITEIPQKTPQKPSGRYQRGIKFVALSNHFLFGGTFFSEIARTGVYMSVTMGKNGCKLKKNVKYPPKPPRAPLFLFAKTCTYHGPFMWEQHFLPLCRVGGWLWLISGEKW